MYESFRNGGIEMGIDMSNYKMIYKDQVFNVVGIMPILDFTGVNNAENNGFKKVKFIEASVIDENGELAIINDEAWMFKFVRR
jgi:hypothetical protein